MDSMFRVDDRRGIVDPEEPSLVGNHMITAIEIPADVNDPRLVAIAKAKDGKRYLIFDPTNERVPVGHLPEYEQGGYGILSAGSASQVIQLPILPPEANPNERKGEFTLAADGGLTGTVDTIRSGASRRGRAATSLEVQRRKRSGARRWRPRWRMMCPAWCSTRSNMCSPRRSTSRLRSTTR